MQTAAVWWRARLSSRIGLCWKYAWLADGCRTTSFGIAGRCPDEDFCRKNWIADSGLRYGVVVRELNCFVRGQFIQEQALVPRVGSAPRCARIFLRTVT